MSSCGVIFTALGGIASARVSCVIEGDDGGGVVGEGWDGLAQPVISIAETAASIQKSILVFLLEISMHDLLYSGVDFGLKLSI